MLLQNPFAAAPTGNQNTQVQNPGNQNPQGGNQNTSGNQNQNSINDTTQGNGNNPDPNNPDPNKVQANGDSPLGDFTKLWDTDPVDPKNPPQVDTGYLPKIDPVKLNEMLGQMDFTKSIKPEQLAAVAAGGEGGVKEMMAILNSTMRQGMATMFTASSRMVESGLTTAKGKFLSEVPGSVKGIMLENSLTSSNPIIKNPAYSKVVNDVRAQFQQKYPKATPAELEAGVNKYFDDMIALGSKAKDKNTETPDNTQLLKQGNDSADWTKWIEPELQN